MNGHGNNRNTDQFMEIFSRLTIFLHAFSIYYVFCRKHVDEFDNDSPHKPPAQNVAYRDDTAGRANGSNEPQHVEVV